MKRHQHFIAIIAITICCSCQKAETIFSFDSSLLRGEPSTEEGIETRAENVANATWSSYVTDISSSSNDNLFELTNLPDGCTVRWESSSNIDLTYTTGFFTYASYIGSEAMETGRVKATLMFSDGSTLPLPKEVNLWKPNINLTETLITGSLQDGYFRLPYPSPVQTTYTWNIDFVEDSDISNGYYIVNFTPYTGETPDGYFVSVDFVNPLGEATTIVRYFN